MERSLGRKGIVILSHFFFFSCHIPLSFLFLSRSISLSCFLLICQSRDLNYHQCLKKCILKCKFHYILLNDETSDLKAIQVFFLELYDIIILLSRPTIQQTGSYLVFPLILTSGLSLPSTLFPVWLINFMLLWLPLWKIGTSTVFFHSLGHSTYSIPLFPIIYIYTKNLCSLEVVTNVTF